MSAHDWFGCARVEAPRGRRASAARAVHPESLRRLDRGAVRGAAAARSTPTPTRCRAPTRRRCGRAGGAVALVDALLGGEARASACRALRPPGHHAEARAGDGLLLLRQRRGRGAARDVARTALERVLILDWDVHHGNGTNDIFHADADVLFVSIHESPLYPGTGPGVGRRARARARATRSTCRCPAARGDAVYRSLVEHVACALIRAWEPQLVLVSAGLRRPPRRPAGDLPRDRGRLRGMTASLRRAARRASARRWGWCSRAATTSARWRARWRR